MERHLLILVTVLISFPILGQEKYKAWPINWTPFKKHDQLYQEFKVLKFSGKHETRADFKRRYEIIVQVTSLEPDWTDGMWMLGDEGMVYGGTFTKEEDLEFSRKIYVNIRDTQKRCLKLQPKNPLCQFYLSGSLGQIATIDGIFTALRSGAEIRDLLIGITESPFDHVFQGGYTLQNSARIGLGMFYRLVPDLTILDWFFDIRGNIDKSIAYHREVYDTGHRNPCNNLLLAASLLCKSENEEGDLNTQEGRGLLTSLIGVQPGNDVEKICLSDSQKIMGEPDLSCGYTITKQQDVENAEQNLAH